MPPHACQFLLHPLVPLLVAYYLCMPVIGSRLGHHKQPAPLMPMPEAPVHKDARPVFPQHNVRFPRQSRMVKPISKATSPQEFPHQHFWLRILSLYRSHAPVPLFRSKFVHSAMGVGGGDLPFCYAISFILAKCITLPGIGSIMFHRICICQRVPKFLYSHLFNVTRPK